MPRTRATRALRVRSYPWLTMTLICSPKTIISAYPHGGMGGITQAMARAAESLGAEIRVNSPVERILVRGGRAVGVELADGERIEADVVLSNADPKRTFLSLVDENDVAPEVVRGIRRLKTDVVVPEIPRRPGRTARLHPLPGRPLR